MNKHEIDFGAGVTLNREILKQNAPTIPAARKIIFRDLIEVSQKPAMDRATAMILEIGALAITKDPAMFKKYIQGVGK